MKTPSKINPRSKARQSGKIAPWHGIDRTPLLLARACFARASLSWDLDNLAFDPLPLGLVIRHSKSYAKKA